MTTDGIYEPTYQKMVIDKTEAFFVSHRESLSRDRGLNKYVDTAVDALEKMLTSNRETEISGAVLILQLIFHAENGNSVSHRIACKLYARLVKAGGCRHVGLQDYVLQHIDEPKVMSRGQHSEPFLMRDIVIAQTVELVMTFGYKLTRSEQTKRHSACSIVALALGKVRVNMNEAAVYAIWNKALKQGGQLVPPVAAMLVGSLPKKPAHREFLEQRRSARLGK
jgi:hypothetical protein